MHIRSAFRREHRVAAFDVYLGRLRLIPKPSNQRAKFRRFRHELLRPRPIIRRAFELAWLNVGEVFRQEGEACGMGLQVSLNRGPEAKAQLANYPRDLRRHARRGVSRAPGRA